MIIDLDETSVSWFEIEDGGRVGLRLLSYDAWKEIKNKTVKKKVDYKKVEGVASRFEHEEVDSDLQNELMWDQMIVAWENFFDKNGKEIPCTRENKMLLMQRSAKFARFVIDSVAAMQAARDAHEEMLEKN